MARAQQVHGVQIVGNKSSMSRASLHGAFYPDGQVLLFSKVRQFGWMGPRTNRVDFSAAFACEIRFISFGWRRSNSLGRHISHTHAPQTLKGLA